MRAFFLSLALWMGCITGPSAQGPSEPYNQVGPQPWYRTVWDSTASCVKETRQTNHRSFDDIRWFVMLGDVVYWDSLGNPAVGAWYPPADIYIGQYLFRGNDHWIIAHEAMHVMLDEYGHPPDPFARCLPRMYPKEFPKPHGQ